MKHPASFSGFQKLINMRLVVILSQVTRSLWGSHYQITEVDKIAVLFGGGVAFAFRRQLGVRVV
jgi:hypothetical protein